MSAPRIALVVVAAIVAACWATPALAAEPGDSVQEHRIAPAFPAPAQGGDWSSCRFDPEPGWRRKDPCCPSPCCPRDCWGFRFGLLGWLPGLDGNLTLGGEEYDVDFDWTDWFDNLDKIDFAIQLFAQVRYQKWYFEVGGLRMVLGDSVPLDATSPNNLTLDTEVTTVIARATVGYEFYRCSTNECGPFPCLSGIFYAGARYMSIDVEGTLLSDVAGRRVLDDTHDWVDPIFGVRGVWDLSRCWSLIGEADVGGFSIASDFAWHLLGAVEWRLAEWFGIQLGWSVLDVKYSEGHGTERFVWDLRMSGPFMNLVFMF